MLHELLQRLGSHGVLESVISMAHRGRLNVLVNILGKNPGDLFDEFEGNITQEKGSGDVKYHQGFSTNGIRLEAKCIWLCILIPPT